MYKIINDNKRILTLALILSLVGSLSTSKVAFANSCEETYGGGQDCDREVKIEKTVSKDQDGNNQDKSYSESVTLKSGEKNHYVTFKIVVKNRGDLDEKDLEMIDDLPEQLYKIDGALTEDIEVLDNGDSKTFYIRAKVDSSEFNRSNSVCRENKAKVTGKRDGDRRTLDRDSAYVCYGSGVSELPKTGSGEEVLSVALLGLGMLVVGLGIKTYRA